MFTIELLLQVQIFISFFQYPRSTARVDVVRVFPSIIVLLESLPPNLELEPVTEPTGVHVLLYNPKFLVIHLHGWWLRFATIRDCVRLRFRQHVDVELR